MLWADVLRKSLTDVCSATSGMVMSFCTSGTMPRLTVRIRLLPKQVRSRLTDQNQLRISSRGFTTVTATSLQPRLLVTGITALSVTTSAVPSRHTMTKVMLSGRQTMISMVTSATSTAVGGSFLSAS